MDELQTSWSLSVEATNIHDLQQATLKRLLGRAWVSEDPELFREAPAQLHLLHTAESAHAWRHDASALAAVMDPAIDTSDLAERMRLHYNDRFKGEALDATATLLQANPNSRRALLTCWHPGDSERPDGAACVVYVYFRRRAKHLQVHAHMRACDAYKKLPANLLILAEAATSVAGRLSVPVGGITLMIDSLHVYKADRPQAMHLAGL